MNAKLAASGVVVLAAVAVILSSIAAAGSGAAEQRVAIETRILPQGTFVLKPLQAGALKRDSGTVSGNWRDLPGRKVMRAGHEVTVFSGTVWTLTGKQGTLTIRERNEWVAVGNDDGIAVGTWKVVRGTGQYARLTGSGGSGHAGLGSPWYARYEGILSSP
jgi:hypothetical protein